jgi:hypothetical protein
MTIDRQPSDTGHTLMGWAIVNFFLKILQLMRTSADS